jgi:hypothetical protein
MIPSLLWVIGDWGVLRVVGCALSVAFLIGHQSGRRFVIAKNKQKIIDFRRKWTIY